MSASADLLEPASADVLHGRLSALSARWGLPVALVLARGPRRYSELARALPGTAPKTLSASLAGLKATGLVALHGAPPRYALTPEGRRLVAALLHVMRARGARPGAAAPLPPR